MCATAATELILTIRPLCWLTDRYGFPEDDI